MLKNNRVKQILFCLAQSTILTWIEVEHYPFVARIHTSEELTDYLEEAFIADDLKIDDATRFLISQNSTSPAEDVLVNIPVVWLSDSAVLSNCLGLLTDSRDQEYLKQIGLFINEIA